MQYGRTPLSSALANKHYKVAAVLRGRGLGRVVPPSLSLCKYCPVVCSLSFHHMYTIDK